MSFITTVSFELFQREIVGLFFFSPCWSSQASIKDAVHMSKSVEATRAHLQGQLRSKEAENNRLTVQLRVHI